MQGFKLAASIVAGIIWLASNAAGAQEVRIAHIYSKTGPLEAYGKHYTMAWPQEEYETGRSLRVSPLSERLKAQMQLTRLPKELHDPKGPPVVQPPLLQTLIVRHSVIVRCRGHVREGVDQIRASART